MKLAIAGLTLALLFAAPAYAQDGTATPDKSTAATRPNDSKPGASGQSSVGVDAPKIDPKLIIDVFKHLTRPRPRPAPPPAPLPVEPAKPVVAAPALVPPRTVVTPPSKAVPTAAPAAAAPKVVKPRPTPLSPPATKAPPTPAPIAIAEPAAPVEPVIARPVVPAPAPAPVTPVRESSTAAPAPALPAQRNASLLSQRPWLLLALLAAAAAIAAATVWSRARRIGRTRAALSLEPRLDLAEGSCSADGLALACPPMSIRTRLDFA
jgi:hypothetical protein